MSLVAWADGYKLLLCCTNTGMETLAPVSLQIYILQVKCSTWSHHTSLQEQRVECIKTLLAEEPICKRLEEICFQRSCQKLSMNVL